MTQSLIVLPKLVADKIKDYNIKPFTGTLEQLYELLKHHRHQLIYRKILKDGSFQPFSSPTLDNHNMPIELDYNIIINNYGRSRYGSTYSQISEAPYQNINMPQYAIFVMREVIRKVPGAMANITYHSIVFLINHNPGTKEKYLLYTYTSPLLAGYNWLKRWFV